MRCFWFVAAVALHVSLDCLLFDTKPAPPQPMESTTITVAEDARQRKLFNHWVAENNRKTAELIKRHAAKAK